MILLMRPKWIYLLLILTILLNLYSCSSHEALDPLPVEPIPTGLTFNKGDSVALVKIYKQGDGANWWSSWNFNDIKTWGGTGWAIVGNEYRCVELFMKAKDLGNGTISSYIENLEYLVKFEASGKAIGGEVPTTIKQLKHLKSFYLINTSVTKIPDDMFNENFQQIYITSNERLGGALPSSLSKLKGGESFNPKIVFLITNNAYTGAIPTIKNAEISLSGNNLTSYPMEIAGRYKVGEYGVWASNNKLSGVIPEEILKDTLRLYKFSRQVSLQQEGYEYTNMPSNEELTKMYETYKINHPNIKEYE